MKAPSAAAVKGNEGTGTPVIALIVNCYATQDNGQQVYQGMIDTKELPWQDSEFLSKLVQVGFKGVVYRSEKAKAAIGLKAGEAVSTEQFVAGIKATTFRGDAKPNKDDETEAARILRSVEAGNFTAEQAVEGIKASYGWEVTPDLAGFVQHCFRKRMKVEAEKAETLDLADLL